MSTHDVPGANPRNADVLAMGAWAEHADGSLILVHALEAGAVVYSIYDMALDPPVEYTDSMPEAGFKSQFSWVPGEDVADQWTWHDKTPFPWSRVMADFPAGTRSPSAAATMTAAQRLAESLDLRAQVVRERHDVQPTEQRAARTLGQRIGDAIDALRP